VQSFARQALLLTIPAYNTELWIQYPVSNAQRLAAATGRY
jgi:hypothetical protein